MTYYTYTIHTDEPSYVTVGSNISVVNNNNNYDNCLHEFRDTYYLADVVVEPTDNEISIQEYNDSLIVPEIDFTELDELEAFTSNEMMTSDVDDSTGYVDSNEVSLTRKYYKIIQVLSIYNPLDDDESYYNDTYYEEDEDDTLEDLDTQLDEEIGYDDIEEIIEDTVVDQEETEDE